MNNDIEKDLYTEKVNEFINENISKIIKNDPKILLDNEILQIEYDIDGNKKDIYSLASERDIKNIQLLSDKNELEFKLSSNKITKKEYDTELKSLEEKKIELNLLYDDLIFNIIDTTSIEDIKEKIISHHLNSIDLERLAKAISSVAENKINEFTLNNKSFMLEKVSYWNYKYNKISKAISKSREVESFILSLT